MTCQHPLCELIGGACSLATRRSRGCRPNLAEREVAAEVYEELRVLLAVLGSDDAPSGSPGSVAPEERRVAAARLAALVRREALEDRNVVLLARSDEPELAPALTKWCRQRGP